MIATILLAAGHARRFGAPKLVQDLHGKPVIRWSADLLVAAALGEVVVVVPPDGSLEAALAGLSARRVVNPDPAAGMASSIARGVEQLAPDSKAVLVALGDEPTISRAVVRSVVDRYKAGHFAIVAPRYQGIPGHPVLFDRSVFGELAELTGDTGARSVVERDPARVAIVEFDQEPPLDVDLPGDLEWLRGSRQRS